ncbi:hypothetical protein ACWDBO_07140 [Streptomyces mirabilis]|uniref:hypothetical protein n=1 Tax=Streptomyces mirabilis TaxID=68239 RepID=UPI00333275F1
MCDALVVVPARRDERLRRFRQPDDPFTLARLHPKIPPPHPASTPRGHAFSPLAARSTDASQPPEPA